MPEFRQLHRLIACHSGMIFNYFSVFSLIFIINNLIARKLTFS